MAGILKRSPLVDSALHIIKGSICAILRLPTGMPWFNILIQLS
jgi:hypothetical protein